MVEKQYTVTGELGLHARPAAKLVAAVTPFAADVKLAYKEREVNLKSIMGVMSLGISRNKDIRIIADGSDEEQLIAAVDELMKAENLID